MTHPSYRTADLDGFQMVDREAGAPGAVAYRRDLLTAEIRFLDTGHFAVETHACRVAQYAS